MRSAGEQCPRFTEKSPFATRFANSSNREPGVVWQGHFDLEQLNSEWLKEREKGCRQITARNFTSARLSGLSWRPFAIARG